MALSIPISFWQLVDKPILLQYYFGGVIFNIALVIGIKFLKLRLETKLVQTREYGVFCPASSLQLSIYSLFYILQSMYWKMNPSIFILCIIVAWSVNYTIYTLFEMVVGIIFGICTSIFIFNKAEERIKNYSISF